MTDESRRLRRASTLVAALVGVLAFGILVLADEDWIPGTIIVVAALVAIAAQVAAIRKLRHTPGPPTSTPVG